MRERTNPINLPITIAPDLVVSAPFGELGRWGFKEKYMNYYMDRLRSAEFNAWMVFGSIVMCAIILLIAGCNNGWADIPDDLAVKAIIGEAENQGYNGMKAVACVIRNRGSLKGVYGVNAPRVKAHKYSEDTEAKAIVAWETSANQAECEYMQDSTHWENIKAFGKPYWADSMTKTVLIKDHQFYREK